MLFYSALFLANFIIMHTGAALVTRNIFGLDTTFYWPAGTLMIEPLRFVFAPYYVLGITALGAHLLAALHFRKPSRWHGPALLVGPALGMMFALGYGGHLYPVDLPQEYRDYYTQFPFVDD